MPKPETTLANAVKQRLKSRGWYAWKVHGNRFQKGNLPDIQAFKPLYAMKPGVVTWRLLLRQVIALIAGAQPVALIWIELKLPHSEGGDDPDAGQAGRMRELRRFGAIVGTVRSVDEIDALLNKMENGSDE